MATTLDTIEDSVHLLREAGMPALVRHWTGSVPFAIGVVLFWHTMNGYRVSGGTCALAALGLTVLLVWMSAWRAVFAVELMRLQEGGDGPRWTAGSVARLAQNQAILGAAKLWLLPLAGVAIVPLPWLTAFFRNAAAFSDFGLREATARARRCAGVEQRQNWLALIILALLTLPVFLNIIVVLGGLPYLFKSLTGIESIYTRGDALIDGNPLLFLAAGLATWLAIDPLVQAFYCVRAFRAQSLETGADLRARLRAIRKLAATAAVVAMLVSLPGRAHAAVAPADLNRSIDRTLQSKVYDWRIPEPPKPAVQENWFVSFTHRMLDHVRDGFKKLREWIDKLIDWLLSSKHDSEPADRAQPGGGIANGLYVLIAVLAIGALFAAWQLRRRREPETVVGATALSPADVHDESLTADRLPEDEWYALAERCILAGDLRAALRALYLGNLSWLSARQVIAIHPAKTNREYHREVTRRLRAVPEAALLLSANIDTYERSWYGSHPAALDDIDRFRLQLARMKEVAA